LLHAQLLGFAADKKVPIYFMADKQME